VISGEWSKLFTNDRLLFTNGRFILQTVVFSKNGRYFKKKVVSCSQTIVLFLKRSLFQKNGRYF
jgi:hypothetical protein